MEQLGHLGPSYFLFLGYLAVFVLRIIWLILAASFAFCALGLWFGFLGMTILGEFDSRFGIRVVASIMVIATIAIPVACFVLVRGETKSPKPEAPRQLVNVS